MDQAVLNSGWLIGLFPSDIIFIDNTFCRRISALEIGASTDKYRRFYNKQKKDW
ncbi:MAG TPA: hypothetical protein VK249_05630 [Anaerolineales bacterium]|nr:hypothetical protein [Anaerolineales bacterium]